VYLWSEAYGVELPRMEVTDGRHTYVSSLSFSSAEGGQSILAIGRNNGEISLWSLYDSDGTRFKCQQPSPVACVAFKPVATPRFSQRFGSLVSTEELLVGDEAGHVYYYSIEWMTSHQSDIHGWPGAMSLMAKICVHNQQICGLSWSHDGEFFATGANDNGCCLFDVEDILAPSNIPRGPGSHHREPQEDLAMTGIGTISGPSKLSALGAKGRGSEELLEEQSSGHDVDPKESSDLHRSGDGSLNGILYISEGRQKHKWIHSAAIKAIAFCPWQRGLLATGGGSNDRAIHFYHTFSGACLATIDVQAQVTSLIWSTGRREIAATFGYAQPTHPYRIAVFSWPECKQILAIPWENDLRALLAIPYPGGPNKMSSKAGEGETWGSRTAEEGCIVVACSDESVKFHEVWSGRRKSTVGQIGLLGGSDILESLEGIDKEGSEVIR
jgi:meiosis-specific APC/C activator protein AMA1